MGDGNKVEFLVAICALLTSAMAVYMAWDQGRVMRAQQHGMVYPVLQVDGFGNYNKEFGEIGLIVSNSGVGPALIESVNFKIDDERYGEFSDYVDTLPETRDVNWSGITGRAIAPGDSIKPLRIFWPPTENDPAILQRVSIDSQNWKLEICYCSVFARCWLTQELGQSRAKPVDACEKGEIDIFEQLGQENLFRAVSTETLEETPQ